MVTSEVIFYHYKTKLCAEEKSPVTPHKCFPLSRSRDDIDAAEYNKHTKYDNNPKKKLLIGSKKPKSSPFKPPFSICFFLTDCFTIINQLYKPVFGTVMLFNTLVAWPPKKGTYALPGVYVLEGWLTKLFCKIHSKV